MASSSPASSASFTEMFKANPRGWWIVLFMFMALAVVFSARSTLGLMMPTWEQDLGWQRTFMSTGGSIVLIMMTLASPMAGNLLDRTGPRLIATLALLFVGIAIAAVAVMGQPWHFILLFCVIGGLGFGSLSAPQASATIGQLFTEHRGLATGIATSGASGGQFLIIPLFAALVGAIGWRWSFAGFGLLIVAMAPVAWLLIPARAKPKPGSAPGENLGSRLRLICGSATFWLLFAGFVICGFTTTGVIEGHLIPYATSCGFPRLQGATAYGVLSAFNMAGMILAGFLADKVHRPLLLGAIYFFRGISFFLLMNITGNPELLFLFAVMFGIFDYSTMPILASIVGTHIGVHVMGLSLGLLFAGHSAGAAAGFFMGGYLYDMMATYEWVWLISIGLALLAAVFSWLIRETRDSGRAPVAAAA